jgi:hypothetical protein
MSCRVCACPSPMRIDRCISSYYVVNLRSGKVQLSLIATAPGFRSNFELRRRIKRRAWHKIRR